MFEMKSCIFPKKDISKRRESSSNFSWIPF